MKMKKERKVKIRNFWTRNPVQRVKTSDKIYSRKKERKNDHD